MLALLLSKFDVPHCPSELTQRVGTQQQWGDLSGTTHTHTHDVLVNSQPQRPSRAERKRERRKISNAACEKLSKFLAWGKGCSQPGITFHLSLSYAAAFCMIERDKRWRWLLIFLFIYLYQSNHPSVWKIFPFPPLAFLSNFHSLMLVHCLYTLEIAEW